MQDAVATLKQVETKEKTAVHFENQGKKVLIAYYSLTGTTRNAADRIHKAIV